MRKLIFAIASTVLLGLAASMPANAGTITYALVGVTASNGYLTGTVTFDPTGQILTSSGDITIHDTADGVAVSGLNITNFTFSGGTGDITFEDSSHYYNDINEVDLAFSLPPIPGGEIALIPAESFEDIFMYLPPYVQTNNDITGGVLAPAVAATPEPGSLVLLGTGILGVAGAARRRFLNR